MGFVVTVMCAAHISCPIAQPLVTDFKADSKQACLESAHSLLKHFGYKPVDFVIRCEPK